MRRKFFSGWFEAIVFFVLLYVAISTIHDAAKDRIEYKEALLREE